MTSSRTSSVEPSSSLWQLNMKKNASEIFDIIQGAFFTDRQWLEDAKSRGLVPAFFGHCLAHLSAERGGVASELGLALGDAVILSDHLKQSPLPVCSEVSSVYDMDTGFQLHLPYGNHTTVDHFGGLFDQGPNGMTTCLLFYHCGEWSLKTIHIGDHRMPWKMAYRLSLSTDEGKECLSWMVKTPPMMEKHDLHSGWPLEEKAQRHRQAWESIFADLSYIDRLVSTGCNAIAVSRQLPLLFNGELTEDIDVMFVILDWNGDSVYEDILCQKTNRLRGFLHDHVWDGVKSEATLTGKKMNVNIWQYQRGDECTDVVNMLERLCNINEESKGWETYMMYAGDADFGLYRKPALPWRGRRNQVAIDCSKYYYRGQPKEWVFSEYNEKRLVKE
ncbi:hypothetical protein CLIM01_09425 [Colletotrichum limetticola]|uniref:Uncharacterized protein n=1 Tax=Colletotrichum limetticola TaxID=1209924 RepID=A0ABQ9PNW8_9PEZI|nr:hypothetical protein CLIM01_09425 [Colletotrichum limetticola]